MKSRLDDLRYLYQDEIVFEIESIFGESFVYLNENGNPAIDKKVLKEFRKITPDVVWEKGQKCWRYREEVDEKSRGQE